MSLSKDAQEVEAAFLFADLSGFTALTEAHGDLDAARLAGRFTEISQKAMQPGAQVVKLIGDEIMVVASDIGSVVLTAVALREAVEHEPFFPGLRIGIHAGSAVEQHGDYFGATVNLAARVAAYARDGQTLCTRTVMEAASIIPDISFESVGEVRFKNVRDAVPLFELKIGTTTGNDTVLDPTCRMRLSPNTAPAKLPYNGMVYHFCSFDCIKAFIQNPDRYKEIPGERE